jgi:protein-tyrosine phosphatase
MRGFIDLHCHWIPSIDDGVRSEDEGVALLRALRDVGFDEVVATPHVRPAMFDNRAPGLRDAYATIAARVERDRASGVALPSIGLAAEHFFDEIVFGLLVRGEGLPYRAGRSVLIELPNDQFPLQLSARLYDLRLKRLRPVIAHPERYEPFWRKPEKAAETMRRAGGVLLLDVCALVGKYGAKAMRTAEALVDEGAYYAACSDAHRPEDALVTREAIARLDALVGRDEVERLFRTGPKEIVEGRIFDEYD